MWPLPRIKNEHIYVVLYADRLICMQFAHVQARVRLLRYRTYDVHVGNIGMLDNISALQAALIDFIAAYALHDAYLHIVLGTNLIQEQCFLHTNYVDSVDQLLQPEQHKSYRLSYIGPREDAFLFYICILSEPLLLQLRILSMALPVHLHRILSSMHAQIAVYTHTAGTAFSHVRLAQAIDIERVIVPTVFSPELMRRSLSVEDDTAHIREELVLAWGAFLGS